MPKEIGNRPDLYLAALAPIYGLVRTIGEPQGLWRHHSASHMAARAFEKNLREGFQCAECCLLALEEHARALGYPTNPEELRHNSRWHQMKEATQRIEAIVPPGGVFVLVDQDHWATHEWVLGRHRFLFVEQDGQWGAAPRMTTLRSRNWSGCKARASDT